MLNHKSIEDVVSEVLALGFSIDPNVRSLTHYMLKRYKHCAHCERPSQHVELIRPQHEGGTFTEENLKTVCSKHQAKH